jgi:hypothetical protein
MERREIKWLRRGCLGCLAFVGLGVMVVILLLMLPLFLQRPESVPVSEEVVPELPPAPPRPVPPDTPSPEGETLPLEAVPGAEEALRVDLDLSAGSFRIEPGPPGEPFKVEADYDSGRFELEQRYDEERNTYRIRFGLRGGWAGLFHGSVEGDNKIRILVPPDRPIALTGEVGMGESRFELGGLWITDVDLDMGMGEHDLRFSKPLRAPLERIAIDGSVGETKLQWLGNASPTRVKVSQSVGQMSMDLRGAWRRDASVDVEVGVGETRVLVPEDVRVEVKRSGVGIGEVHGLRRRGPAPEGGPTLRLRLSGSIGEIRLDSVPNR